MDLNSPELISQMSKILRANNILDPISDVSVKDPNLREEGMGSLRHYVTVKFENQKLPPLNLFTKSTMKDNAGHTEMFEAMKGFEKESRFLTTYVEAAKQLCKNKGVKENIVTGIYPKCYYGDEEIILMENMVVDKAYVILGKTRPHDYDTATWTLKSLATHHALSHAMIMEEGGIENFLKRFPNLGHEGFTETPFVSMFDRWLNNAFNVNVKMLEYNANVIEKAAETASKLRDYTEQALSLTKLMTVPIENDDDPVRVLNHGDSWYTNMMFLKDNANNKILAHKLIDFQILRYNSPAADLSYYLFSSVQTEVRQDRLKELLHGYLETLNGLSEDLGHPLNLDYESLLLQYRKKRAFGFHISFIMQYGPGMAVFKNTDMSKVSLKDWPAVASKLGIEWIADNPEESKRISTEIIKVVEEYFD